MSQYLEQSDLAAAEHFRYQGPPEYQTNGKFDPSKLPVFLPSDETAFDPIAYLKSFYSHIRAQPAECAMKIVLYNLANFVARIPDNPEMRLLDVGSGPTMYMAVYFRKKAKEVYFSDYSKLNTAELKKWYTKDPEGWDWSNLLRTVAIVEMTLDPISKIDEEARAVTKGILQCNVFDDDVIDTPDLAPFDVVTSVFCIEYASQSSDEYKKAITNLVNLVKPGGHLIYCGLHEEGSYYFGNKRFMAHYLEEEEMFSTLEEAGIDMATKQYCEHSGVFIFMGRRKAIENA